MYNVLYITHVCSTSFTPYTHHTHYTVTCVMYYITHYTVIVLLTLYVMCIICVICCEQHHVLDACMHTCASVIVLQACYGCVSGFTSETQLFKRNHYPHRGGLGYAGRQPYMSTRKNYAGRCTRTCHVA